MTGGGIVHGPKPRDYSQRTNKKMIAAALRGALSDRARAGRIHVVKEFGINDKPSTKQAAAIISQLVSGRRVLVVIDRDDEMSFLSLRNLKNLHVLPADQLNAYDVLASDDLIFTAAALEAFVTAKSEVKA
jgi:Ribosomal protein L4